MNRNNIEQKIVLVKAKFMKIQNVETSKYKGEVWGETEARQRETYSDCKVDSEALSEDLQNAISQLNTDGYSVDMITPITSGEHVSKQGYISSSRRLMGGTEAIEGEGSFGYGYSYTDSLIILATRAFVSPDETR